MNKNTALQKLFVGWNGVGDVGAAALAKMIEKNDTLTVLGLSENDITNTGASSLLSSLSLNTSVSEISGLVRLIVKGESLLSLRIYRSLTCS